MPELNTDWLVSVDDHAIEPPNVWLDRLPAKYHDIAPRMVATAGGEAWQYEDKQIPTSGLSVAAGKRHEDFSPDPVPFSEMRPGAYDSVARLADMDQARNPGIDVLPLISPFLRPDLLGSQGQGSRRVV